jgi:chromosome segregation ATPase
MIPIFFAFAASQSASWPGIFTAVYAGFVANAPTAVITAVVASLFTWRLARRQEHRQLSAAEIETDEKRERRVDEKFDRYIEKIEKAAEDDAKEREAEIAELRATIAGLKDEVSQQVALVSRLLGEADAKEQLLQTQNARVVDLLTQVDRLRADKDALTTGLATTNRKLTSAQNALKAKDTDCQSRMDALQKQIDSLQERPTTSVTVQTAQPQTASTPG